MNGIFPIIGSTIMRSVILYRCLNGKLRSIKTDLNVLRLLLVFHLECFFVSSNCKAGLARPGSSRTSTVLVD